jgi:uncharacterized membrane protein (DUF485 family)
MNSSPLRTRTAAADEHPEISAANSRAGLVLFFVYLAFYAAFVGLAAFSPDMMAAPALGGVNLAVCYGLGLILAAFVVAALYMMACAHSARRLARGTIEDRD